MRTVVILLVGAVVVALGAVAFAYSGLYDVSASTPHSGPVQWLLSQTSDAAIQRRAASIDVPDLRADSLAQAGINDYEAMCAGCHGAPGQPPTPLALGLNPPAPDLSVSAQSMSPAELFWVTKHGIKMTGMPAWGASHEDGSLWPIVAFMTRLPDLDAPAYRKFLAAAKGSGHHDGDRNSGDGGHDHGESNGGNAGGSHDHAETANEPSASMEHDASDDHHDGHDHKH